MDLLSDTVLHLLGIALAVLMLGALAWRYRRWLPTRKGRGAGAGAPAADTVADWPPQPARAMNLPQRQAHALLARAMPGCIVLAQVPLSRFMRVVAHKPYGQWLLRAGWLSVDLLLCDSNARVLAVVNLRVAPGSNSRDKRYERMSRVLKAAGIREFVWDKSDLPDIQSAKHQLAPLLRELPGAALPAKAGPLIPVAEMEELLAQGDGQEYDPALQTAHAAFFDKLEANAARH